MLEREREVAALEALIADARDGRGRTAVIAGAAGLGKTRLLHRVRGSAADAGMRVLSARATELEREFPYGVVRQLLGREDAGTGETDDFSTLHSLYLTVADLSHEAPLLIAVDDCQWADAASLRFLAFLAPRIEDLAVFVAIATRPPSAEDPHPLVELRADAAVEHIQLRALGRDAGTQLLASALEGEPDDEFAAACHRVTGGNPFLLVELVRTLDMEEIPPTAASVAAVEELVPAAVAHSVLRRLAPLPPEARAMARAVAVLGDGCDPRHGWALTGLDPGEAADAVDALRGAEILEPEPPLRFLHPLIRKAVYADIPAAARSREHAAAAALLAEDRQPPERIALHLLAVDPARDQWVSKTLYDAARAALEQGAPQSAIAYLRRALSEPPAGDARATPWTCCSRRARELPIRPPSAASGRRSRTGWPQDAIRCCASPATPARGCSPPVA